MWTPVISAKFKMRISVIGDTLLYDIAVDSVKTLISLKGISVNAYLPSDTTAMLALISDTFKAFVIFRCVQFHISLLNRPTMF